jgi:DNA-binding XRE family transcriptional regulator
LKKTRTTTAPTAKKTKKKKQPTNKPFALRFSEKPLPGAKALAANVRRLRKELGLSQAALADEANAKAGQPAIALIELGRANPTLKLIQAIADALGTTCSTLLS